MCNLITRASVLIAGIFFFSFTLYAQDFQKAKDFYVNEDYVNAKRSIDAALKGAEKNNPAAIAWKHRIYWELAADAKYQDQFPEAGIQGFEALSTVAVMPKGDDILLHELGIDYLTPAKVFNNYYVSFINTGSAKMNAEKFSDAFVNFKSAIAVSTYFYEKKMITSDLDTMLNFYAGYVAMKANNNNEAAYYFKKLADRNAGGTDLQIAYGWLTNYYLTIKKDIAAAKAVYTKGIGFYPNDEYLKSMNIQIARQAGNPEELFKSYEATIASGKAEFADYLGYGAELYDYLFVDTIVIVKDRFTKQGRMVAVLNKALQLRPESAEANYILGLYHNSNALLIDQLLKQRKGTGPADLEKEKEYQKDINDQAARSITYFEVACSLYAAKATLKPADKDHYKTALQQLINLYKYLTQPDKVKATEEVLKKLG